MITIWLKIVTILLAIIFFYAGVYRPALVVMFFFLKKEVESVPGFLEFQENRKKSHEMIEQIDEGKNRQVRKMTAAIGFPTLRLIRHAIGGFPCPSSTRMSREQLSVDQIKSIVNP